MDDGRVTMAEVRRTVGRPNAAPKNRYPMTPGVRTAV